jgi:hypothetical protein
VLRRTLAQRFDGKKTEWSFLAAVYSLGQEKKMGIAEEFFGQGVTTEAAGAS